MNNVGAIILGLCIIIAAVILTFRQGTGTDSGQVHFQLVKASDNCIFVIDTRNGRLWERFVSSNSGPTNWSENKLPK